jgi:glycosyltransferase involved in cell wall biosynthesis
VKLRPLFILADLEAGGAQRVLLTVIRHLNRGKFDPHLGIINKAGPLAKEIPDNVCVHDFEGQRVRYALPGIIKICRSLRPDTVVTTLCHLNLSLLAIKFLLPACTHLFVREANTPSFRLLHTRHPSAYRFLYRMLYPLADKVICSSQSMKRDLEESYSLSSRKTIVIANPVDSERIKQALLNRRNPYGPGKYHIASVGRLNYQKGFDLLLRAYKKSLRKTSNIHLTIVGDGPERTNLRELAGTLEMMDCVSFVGHQDNPFPLMAHADLFISCSRWEGLPNAVLEALACGTPVLAFDCPGGTGEVIREGQNGWLVPVGDLEAMSRKIVQIVQNKEQLKLEGESLIPEKYLCQNVVKRYEQLLARAHSLLGE